MKKTRTGTSFIIAAGLMAGSAFTATAQKDADPSMGAAPVEVTGSSVLVGCPSGDTMEDMGLFSRTIGGTCQSDWTFSDERLSGMGTLVANEDNYTDGSDISIGTFSLSIQNEAGGWRMRPGFWLEFPESPVVGVEEWVLDGAGAYDGLTAVLLIEDWAGHGFIFEGEPLPRPENASTK